MPLKSCAQESPQLEVPNETCLAPGHEGIRLLRAGETKPGTCAAQGWKPVMYQTCHLTLVFRLDF